MAIYIPTFDGQAMFGVDPTIVVAPYPHQIAWTSFAGVNGRFGQRHGSRGFFGDAAFSYLAVDATALGVYENLWDSYVNTAVSTTLYDTTGRTWLNVVCTEFTATGPILPAGLGRMIRGYRSHFEVAY